MMPAIRKHAAGMDLAVRSAEASETLEAAYEAWASIRAVRQGARAHVALERRRFEDQGDLLLGAVRTATNRLPAAVLGVGGELTTNSSPNESDVDALVSRAAVQMQTAKQALASEEQEVEAAYVSARNDIVKLIGARVDRVLKHARPGLRLMVRSLPEDRRILHATRMGPEQAIALLRLLTGRIPSRFDFLFDDSTDDARLEPPNLYIDDENTLGTVRPSPDALWAALESWSDIWPVKGMLPFAIDLRGQRQWVRWLQRGPVMEVEVGDAAGYRNVLSKEEAEHIVGALISLKLAGRLDVEWAP